MYPDSLSADRCDPSRPLFGGTTGFKILPVVFPETIDLFFVDTGDNGANLFSSSILLVIELEFPLVFTLISFCSLGTDDLLS